MTDEEYKRKYPIGTRIRFMNIRLDTGKVGTIVGYWGELNKPIVYLPTAKKHIEGNRYPTLPGGIKFTWKCSWNEIKVLYRKGEQLLFEFMQTGVSLGTL